MKGSKEGLSLHFIYSHRRDIFLELFDSGNKVLDSLQEALFDHT
jgi:hypothetical protein